MLRIGVFFGGLSSEAEVSLESGRHLFQNLDSAKYTGVAIYVSKKREFWELPMRLLLMNTTEDIERSLAEATRIPFEQLKEKADFALLALHGKYGEDGCMQGLLELLDIPYNGSGVLASAIGMDKPVARRFMEAAGIKTPRYVLVGKGSPSTSSGTIDAANIPFPLPWIVKPSREGCSTGLSKVTDAAELPKALERAWQWDTTAMIDEFIDGMEVTTTVLGNDEPTALLPSETPPSGSAPYLTLEDKFLPGQAAMITPARLPKDVIEKVQATSVAAFQALGLKGYARIDGFVREQEVLINEVNTLPGATPSTCLFQQAAAAGMTPIDLVSRIIELGIEAQRSKKGPL